MSGHIFSGQHVKKQPINLGGASTASSAASGDELIRRAIEQRQQREQGRKRELAAGRIQAFYRGRSTASVHRQSLRLQLDSVLSSPSDQFPTDQELVRATRLLALSFTKGNPSDRKRLASWTRIVVGPRVGGDKTPLMFKLYSSAPESWPTLLNQLSGIILEQAASYPSSPQTPLYLELLKRAADQETRAKWKASSPSSVIDYLAKRDLWRNLRRVYVALVPNSPSLPALITLTFLPFKSPTSSPTGDNSLATFISQILTLPSTQFPVSSPLVGKLLPFETLLLHLESRTLSTAHPHPDEATENLLLNLLIVESKFKFVEAFKKGDLIRAFLAAVASLIGSLGVGGVRKGKKREFATIEGTEPTNKMDVDTAETGPSNAVTRGSTSASSSIGSLILPLLPIVLTASNRYSNNTRPSLALFLTNLLTYLPNHRDRILNAIIFPNSSGAGERSNGLLRELYRTFLRSTTFGTLIAQSPTNVLSALKDHEGRFHKQGGGEWNVLVLVMTVYERCLVTMGDDEFYSSSPSGGRGAGPHGKSTNPLMLEEVVGLTRIVRNLAFALYWFWDGEALSTDGGERRRADWEGLRKLSTRLLARVHERDSRRRFTTSSGGDEQENEEEFWIVKGLFDLQSFVQTVVLEDEKLDADAEIEQQQQQELQRRQRAAARQSDTTDEDEEMEEDVSHLARRRQIVTRTTPALSKRQLAFISPRLGVLNNIPFVIPFATRVAIFRQFIENDRRRMHLTYEDQMYSRSRHHRATIRRGHVSEDSFASLNGLGGALKGTIQIIFKDQHGIEETGIDGGGLFKELLTELSKEAFDTDRGLWLETAQHELYPNPHAYARESAQLAWYTFMGRILGKALYEGILIEARFSGFFLAKWLGRQSYLDDLADLDPELYNGLIFLKNYTGNVEQDLSLNFTINDEEFGVSRTIELVPGGSDIAVTNENRIRYIYLTSHYRLNGQMALQCAAFFSGLSEIIPERFLRMFNQEELRMLVGGVDRPIDIEDLKANTVYGGWDGDEANDTIRNFWSVVERFDKDDRSKLVKFVTSCARPPLLGFKELNPRFAIRRAGDDQSRLPTSSTCVNLLKLPDFKDKDLLEEKLRLSINAGAGFDLS